MTGRHGAELYATRAQLSIEAQLIADARAEGAPHLGREQAAELIVGPTGTGKTYTAVRMADAWRAGGRGRVVGIATTSAGRNVLLDAGIPVAENTAQFLGHLPGQRQVRGAASLGPDALIILLEASTTSLPDLAAILKHPARSGAKLVITGDHAQLDAVQSGGGMAMLAPKLGWPHSPIFAPRCHPHQGPPRNQMRQN